MPAINWSQLVTNAEAIAAALGSLGLIPAGVVTLATTAVNDALALLNSVTNPQPTTPVTPTNPATASQSHVSAAQAQLHMALANLHTHIATGHTTAANALNAPTSQSPAKP